MINVNKISNDELIKIINKNSYQKITDKDGIDILLIPMAFDIETTNDEETCSAYMYIWQFAIYDKVIYGRTWEEFLKLLYRLNKILNLTKINSKINIFIHNLSYEWQFMRKYLSDYYEIQGFFVENRTPANINLLYYGKPIIRFQDSYLLSQSNLKQTAKDYCKTQKLPDYNYTEKRNHLTVLSERELEYCANDVLILTEYYQYLIDNIILPKQFFPITATQLPRNDVKLSWKSWKKGKNNPNKKLISSIYPTNYQTYKKDMDYLFRGGYTHANYANADYTIEDDILHIDFTSDYPAQLLHHQYPMTQFKLADFKEEYLDKYCCKLLVEFKDIKAKSTISYDSISKAVKYSDDIIEDNGRLLKASHYVAYMTELDFKIYKGVYDWEECNIIKCYIAEKGELPSYLTDIIIKYYSDKSRIKKYGDPKGKDKIKYINSKKLVNAIYGMMCTKLNEVDLAYVDDCYVSNEVDLYSWKNWNDTKNKAFLSPYWGIWCTAWARYELFDLIIQLINNNMSDDYIYSDTDSHFTKDTQFIRNYIENYNKKIAKLNEKYGELLDDLGEYDLEHSPEGKEKIIKFKTLGAKRYLMTVYNKKKDKYETVATIAGLPKTITKIIDGEEKEYNLFEYNADVLNKNPYELFTNKMVFDEILSNKNGHTYNDDETTTIINGVKETTRSGIIIHPITFTLIISNKYLQLLEEFKSIKEKRING